MHEGFSIYGIILCVHADWISFVFASGKFEKSANDHHVVDLIKLQTRS